VWAGLGDLLAKLAVGLLQAYFARADAKKVVVQEVALEAQRLAIVARDFVADPKHRVMLASEGGKLSLTPPPARPEG
jgi:hypothetical protein